MSLTNEKMLGMSLDDLITKTKRPAARGAEKFAKAMNVRKDIKLERRHSDRPKVILRDNQYRQSGTVRVTNVPFDLTWRDIKDAFQPVGEITRCDVENGVATLVFANHRDAVQAVKTYDGGDMNGRIIRAALQSV